MSEEQQKIQKYIIKSTPYGELPEAMKELEKLTPLDPTAPIISNAIQQYNEEHLALFPLKQGQQAYFPLMSISRVGPSKYLDQLSKKTYTVDYLKGEISAVEDSDPELIQSVQQLLTHLSSATAKYTSTYYRQPYGSAVFMHLTEDALDVHVGITSKNVQLNNFVTGQWVSRWVVRKGEIEGTIGISSHFFQSGNVQFHQRKVVKKEFQFEQSMAENAKKIIRIIEQAEGDIQANLSELYQEMPNGFFKHLRRITPLTKTKMVWNINSIKMNRNLLGLKQ